MKQILILFIISTFWGCHRISDSKKNITIDFSEVESNKAFHELANNVEVVEVQSEFIPSNVLEMIVDNEGNLYLKDFISTISRGILKLDPLGKEVFVIKNKGVGPEEFQCIDAFLLRKNKLIFFDCLKRQFFYHDASNGKFIKSESYKDGFINQIESINDNLIVLQTNQSRQSNVSILSEHNFSNENKIISDNDNFLSFFGSSLIQGDNEQVIFKNSLKDTIHIIKNNRVDKSIYLNFGNDLSTMRRLAYEKMSYEERIELFQSSDTYKVTSKVLPFRDYIFFISKKSDNEYFDIIDLSKNTGRRFKYYKDNIPFPTYVKKNIFYSIVEGELLEELIKENKEKVNFSLFDSESFEGKTFILKYELQL